MCVAEACWRARRGGRTPPCLVLAKPYDTLSTEGNYDKIDSTTVSTTDSSRYYRLHAAGDEQRSHTAHMLLTAASRARAAAPILHRRAAMSSARTALDEMATGKASTAHAKELLEHLVLPACAQRDAAHRCCGALL